ncbi:hypothetical protein [Psychrobacter sp. I-STPA6b]|uniref:hypothetical protein n=1 Tax=Psychrobacter sp. I-STPA6b TaxID=2585718 RepID=UPI001D0C8C2D|nr:hypothetical protein [Psychrobacter sp. I-STPA6b]
MKKLSASVLVAVATLVASPVVLANAPSSASKTVNVQFQRGASSANYTGSVTGYNYNEYTFRARKGQKLKVDLAGGNVTPYLRHRRLSNTVNIGENSPALDATGAYVLPYNGVYTIRITQPRASARDGRTQQYSLKIAIR